jgi:hypothetical protein
MSTFFDCVVLAGAGQFPVSTEASQNDIGIDQVFAIAVSKFFLYPVDEAPYLLNRLVIEPAASWFPGTDA